jgi:hypothetical protein
MATGLAVIAHPSVVTGCKQVCAKLNRSAHQKAELDEAVAYDAWIRRASSAVFAAEAIDYKLPELVLKVHDMVIDPKGFCYAPGVGDSRRPRGGAPAASFACDSGPEPHCESDDVVPSLLQESGSH